MIEVRATNAAAVDRTLAGVGTKVPLAVMRALNRTITSVQTAAVREMATDLNILQGFVRKGLTLERATLESQRARLYVNAKRIPLIAFRARQTRQGVTYSLGRGRGLVRGAFVATMGTGHTGVFRRRTRRRLPIIELSGPSLGRVFAKNRRARQDLAQDLMRKNLVHEWKFATRGL
ncbi:MAG TPA: phage tail protein, partial [Gaiellaceae bacterium]|nr:phage tail protein [Gaiellaceae bacterium]